MKRRTGVRRWGHHDTPLSLHSCLVVRAQCHTNDNTGRSTVGPLPQRAARHGQGFHPLHRHRFRHSVSSANGHQLTSDEPPTLGGGNAGMAPFELYLAALALCTAITLRMYAQKKAGSLASSTPNWNPRAMPTATSRSTAPCMPTARWMTSSGRACWTWWNALR